MQTYRDDFSVTPAVPLDLDVAIPDMLARDALVVVVSDGNISRDNPDLAEFGSTKALIERLVPEQQVGVALRPATGLAGWQAGEEGSIAGRSLGIRQGEARIGFRLPATLRNGGFRLIATP